jgi:hypothetical protein
MLSSVTDRLAAGNPSAEELAPHCLVLARNIASGDQS